MMQKIVSGERPLVIPPQLATKIGKWEALLLQQIHHHSSHSKHVIDGAKWFWKTFKSWVEEIPFISVGTIRRAIANLRQLGLILVERHSAKTHYQANWYCPDYEAIRSLCTDGSDHDDHIQAIEPIASYTEINSTEDISTHTPSTAELVEAEEQLKECRINPDAVRRELLKQFANFKGAIAKVRQAQASGWCKNPTGLLVSALRSGEKPDSPDFPREKFEIPAEPEAISSYCRDNPEVREAFFSSTRNEYMIAFKSGIQKSWLEVQDAGIIL